MVIASTILGETSPSKRFAHSGHDRVRLGRIELLFLDLFRSCTELLAQLFDRGNAHTLEVGLDPFVGDFGDDGLFFACFRIDLHRSELAREHMHLHIDILLGNIERSEHGDLDRIVAG